MHVGSADAARWRADRGTQTSLLCGERRSAPGDVLAAGRLPTAAALGDYRDLV